MFKPQLANTINPKTLPKYVNDDLYGWEQKLDGERRAVVVDEGVVSVWGRDGQLSRLSPELVKVFSLITTGRWVFDGELVGPDLWIFDLLRAESLLDEPNLTPFWKRREQLEAVMPLLMKHAPTLKLLPHYKTPADKAAMGVRCIGANVEGIMIKNLNGTYVEGKRSSAVLKCKFVQTVDVVVTEVGRQGKRSIAIGLYDNGTLVDVGSCTVQPRHLLELKVGDVVELKYLYVNDPANPKLYQPRFLKRRDDKGACEATVDQLKFTDKTVLT